ncbi:MAG TPA: hypothetical protein VN668_00160 [Stellaceae bacterium]|nr:hypothetical protein [Stellaceae bacterium]
MHTLHSGRGTLFSEIPAGTAFRCTYEQHPLIGLKISDRDRALVLAIAPGNPQAPLGKVILGDEVGDKPVVALENLVIIPSEREGAASAAGTSATHLEIELRGNDLFLVITPGRGESRRVNLRTGDVGSAPPERTAEIYTRWALVQELGGERRTIFEHRPAVEELARVQPIVERVP